MKRKKRNVKTTFIALSLLILTLCSNAILKAEETEDTLPDIQENSQDPKFTVEYDIQQGELTIIYEENGSGIELEKIYYSMDTIDTSQDDWEDYANEVDLEKMKIPLEETGEEITYFFVAKDNKGNTYLFSRTFDDGIDWTLPSYEETYLTPAQEVDGVYYYNKNSLLEEKQLLEVTFTDNIDLPSTEWGDLQVVNGCSTKATQVKSKNVGNTQTFTVTLSETPDDGIYQFEGTVRDKVGNKLKYTSKKMVYDTKNPVIGKCQINTQEYNANDENKDTVSIYNEPLEFEMEVTDENFDKLEVFYDNKKLEEDTDYTVDEKESNIYIVTILKNVRNAKLSVNAVDKAKNKSGSKTVVENLFLDTLEPQIVKGSVCINGKPLIYENEKDRPAFYPVNNLLTFTIEDEDDFQIGNLKMRLLNDKGDPVKNKEIKVKDKTVDSKTVEIEAQGFVFSEGEYSLQITYTDEAHDAAVCTTGKFLIDGTPPKLEFSTGTSKKYTVGENAAKAQVADLEISDNNLANNIAEEKVFTWNLEITDARGNAINTLHCFVNDVEKNDITPEELADYLGTLDNWQKTKTANTYRTHIEFVTEGNYQIKDAFAHDSVYRSDNKGNAGSFTIDGTNPYFRADGGGVTFAKRNNKQILKETPYSDFQYITREDVEVTLIVEDEISDIKKVTLSYTADGEKAAKNAEASADKQTEGKYVFYIPDVEKSFKATIHNISITDACGNTRVHAINRGVIVDKEKQVFELMQVTIQDSNADNKKVICNKDINLLFSVRDTWSGLQTVTYELNQTEKNKTFSGGNVVYEWNSGEGKIVLKAVPENEGESIPVTLRAIDNAGNEQKISKSYMIDITKPEVSLSFTDDEAGTYFNQDRTAVITVKDKHIDTKDITVTVMKNGEEIPVNPTFKTTDNETYTAKVSFGKDGKKFAENGDYQIFVGCKDLAGNAADTVKSKKFTIDQTSPVIRVSFDNNNARNGNYYNSQRTATITVEEHNFDAALLNLDIQGTLDGTDIHVPSVGEFSSEGDVHTAQVTFNASGDYVITGSITDAAGNISNSMTRDEFTIDLETPVVKITGVNSGESYNDGVQPLIEVQDTNFNSSDVSIVLQGSKTGKKELKYGKTETEKTGSYRYEDFPHVVENDDYYTLMVQVTDMAGNQYEEEIGFKVNRFGSTYVLDDYTKAAVDAYYTNVANDFVIMEENVNEIVESQLYYSKDGDITYLEKDIDYTVSHDVNSDKCSNFRYSHREIPCNLYPSPNK